MELYKVRAWVNQRKKGSLEQPYYFEEVVLNKDTATSLFSREKGRVKTYEGLRSIELIHCEVFVPHIFEDGTLAYWPDNNEYIEKYEG